MPYKDRSKQAENNRKWRLSNPDYMTEYWRKLRAENPEKTLEYSRRKNKAKTAARMKLNGALRKGVLAKPPKCMDCSSTSVEAHHPDYAQALSVIWLCRECHVRLHRVYN